MKTLVVSLLTLGCAGLGFCLAGECPRGDLLELHSCELYAGGCVVSSESTLGGRYMLRAWNFTGGEFSGVNLTGLTMAALQLSDQNQAAPDARPGRAVLYLPKAATPAQRAALAGWFTSREFGAGKSNVQTRIVSTRFTRTIRGGCQVSAAGYVSVSAIPMGHCATWSCGESLWYAPREETSAFAVGVDNGSVIHEPLLKLKWEDSGKKNVFLARFDESKPARNRYVGQAELFATTN